VKEVMIEKKNESTVKRIKVIEIKERKQSGGKVEEKEIVRKKEIERMNRTRRLQRKKREKKVGTKKNEKQGSRAISL